MKKVTDLTENEVIHCSTKEEYDAICKLLHEAGYKWGIGNSYNSLNVWIIYKENTCVYPKVGEYCSHRYYEQQGYTIYPASDFLNPVQTKEEYAKQKAVGFTEWVINKLLNTPADHVYSEMNKVEIYTSELYDEFEKQLKSEDATH